MSGPAGVVGVEGIVVDVIFTMIIITMMIKVSSSVASLALTESRLAIGFNCGAVEVLSHCNEDDDDDHDMVIKVSSFFFIMTMMMMITI